MTVSNARAGEYRIEWVVLQSGHRSKNVSGKCKCSSGPKGYNLNRAASCIRAYPSLPLSQSDFNQEAVFVYVERNGSRIGDDRQDASRVRRARVGVGEARREVVVSGDGGISFAGRFLD